MQKSSGGVIVGSIVDAIVTLKTVLESLVRPLRAALATRAQAGRQGTPSPWGCRRPAGCTVGIENGHAKGTAGLRVVHRKHLSDIEIASVRLPSGLVWFCMRIRANRATVASCRLLLNAHELRANGCLRPGWSGKWSIDGDGKAKVLIHLRAEADRLHLSWNRRSLDSHCGDLHLVGASGSDEVESSEEGIGEEETVSLVHFSNHFGGGYTLFVCPGASMLGRE
jgi:hypothetical protein